MGVTEEFVAPWQLNERLVSIFLDWAGQATALRQRFVIACHDGHATISYALVSRPSTLAPF